MAAGLLPEQGHVCAVELLQDARKAWCQGCGRRWIAEAAGSAWVIWRREKRSERRRREQAARRAALR